MEKIVIFFYILLLARSIANIKENVFIYVLHLPLLPIVVTNGTIPLNDFFGYILFLRFIFHKGKSLPVGIKPFQKSSIAFLTLTVIISILNKFKSTIMVEGHVSSLLSHILFSINLIVTIFCITYILKLVVCNEIYRELVKKALIYSAILLFFSAVFSDELYAMGFNIPEKSIDTFRSGGLYAGGDVNGLASFYNMVTAFVLINLSHTKDKHRNQKYIILVFLAIATFMTASRMGVSTFVILTVFYIFFVKRNFSAFFISLLAISIILGIVYFTQTLMPEIMERFSDNSLMIELDKDQEGGRVYLWMYYLTYCFSSQSVLFYGTTNKIAELTPHNFYIYSLYFNGIIIVTFFLILMILYFRMLSKLINIVPILMLSVSLIISLMSLTSSHIIFVCCVVCSVLVAQSNKLKLK